MRRSGVLLPITSLSSKYGIGCFSKEAYEFIDFLEAAGQSYWQILPMGPTGYGDSPYQSFSTFAGNPYFIDLTELIDNGWLTKKECDKVDLGTDETKVDYEKIYFGKFKLLRKAYAKSNIANQKEFKQFVKDNAFWLEDYALYMAIKTAKYKGKGFMEWKDEDRLKKPKAMKAIKSDPKMADEILFWKFLQYMFFKQWIKIKNYANSKNIKIIGDIPIYVALDSADTWSDPKLFKLDKDGKPVGVAGCPPDCFSETGQLWGNPLYDWDYHKKTEYAWWIKRIEMCFSIYDVVRIDHFRGFDEYYFIPYGDETAVGGHWEKGPGYDLFAALKKALGKKEIIAEDLGFLTDSVVKLVKKCGYPGMKILEFAFDSDSKNVYIPYNYDKNSIVYTGTHDNDTVVGWFKSADKKTKQRAKKFLGCKSDKDICWSLIKAAFASVSDTVIIPLQDYLELGAEARINIPSTLGNNWDWRMKADVCSSELADKIKDITEFYDRLGNFNNL